MLKAFIFCVFSVFLLIVSVNGDNETDNATCGIPPDIEEATAPDLNDAEHALGTVIKYQCSLGYVSRISGGFPSTCEINERTGKAEWTKPKISCSARSCGDPGYITNGRRIGNLFTFPNRVEFECDEGYKLKGLKSRYCQVTGEWSGARLPTCELINCTAPANPVNGRVSYSSLGYESELQYECNPGFVLKKPVTRVCASNGEWSNQEPECIEVTCEKPPPPERGSVQFSDGLAAGSLATYSCEEGTTLVGAVVSKCLDNGIWLFDPAKCLRSCEIPGIENGVTGFFKSDERFRQTHQEFVPFQVGETVKHGVSVIVRCDQGFTPVDRTTFRNRDTDGGSCNDGFWSKSTQCVPSRCLGPPPSMANGSPVVKTNIHGSVISYNCKEGFSKLRYGNVTCVYGTWRGQPPVCGDLRCHTDDLNYPGLKRPPPRYFDSNKNFKISCEEGYEKTSSKKEIRCFERKWEIESNPCTISITRIKCEEEPPQIQNGRFEAFNREHGSRVRYRCDANFEVSRESSVFCNVNKWEGYPAECRERPTRQSDIENGKHALTAREPSSSSSSISSDTCYCIYGYSADYVVANSRNRPLNVQSRIRRGETVNLSCMYGGMDLVWMNGLSVYGSTVNLTCDTCKNWSQRDLPYCRPRQQGDSLLFFTRDMKILPGGIIEVSRGQDISFHCMNFFKGPAWHPSHKRGTSVYSAYNTEYHSASLKINGVMDSHAGTYECYASETYYTYRSTKFILKIVESEIKCPQLEINTNRGKFTIHYENDRNINSVARYACQSQTQKLIGASTRECRANGKWSGSTPSCEDITCTWFNVYNSLVVTYTNGNKVNSRATFRCNSNAILTGENSVVCMPNGQWSHSRPSCEMLEIRCPALNGKGIFSIHYDNDRRIGSNAAFQCIGEGLKISGCAFRICQQNGEWSGDDPTCVGYPTSCNMFESSENLLISYSNDVKVGSIATFSCAFPYTLVGSLQAMCQQNGVWNRPLPYCEARNCSVGYLFDILPQGVYPNLTKEIEDHVPFGTELQLACEPNLFLSGSSKTKCGPHGRWEHEDVQCIEGCTLGNTTSASQLLIDPVKDYYLFGEAITFSCPPGQKLNSEVQRVMCLNPSWSDPIPDCVEAPQANPSNSRKG